MKTAGFLARYDALPGRERILIAFALFASIGLVAWVALIDPARARFNVASQAIAEQGLQIATLKQQLTLLQAPRKGAEAQARGELERLQLQHRNQGTRLLALEAALVPPQGMSALLEDLIGRRSGLRLVSLHTLAAASMLEKKSGEATGAAAKKTGEAAAAAKGQAELYKHGVEITLEGSYAELSAYLARLEAAPQKLLWSNVALSADKHPKLMLTLTVFTLSLDRTWLIV